MSSIQAYLAEKYMSGPKADAILSRTAPKKKKRRKPDDEIKPSPSGAGGANIVDDDAGWGGAANAMEVEEDDASEAVVASDRAFKKRRAEPGSGEGAGAGAGGGGGEEGSGWMTVREPTPPPAPDEQPVVVTAEDAPAGPFRGGLLTKKQLHAHLPSSSSSSIQDPHKRDGKQRAKGEEEEDPEAGAAAQETVYRDSSGRKIDMKLERAEAARKKREREEREAQKMEWGKGLVQRGDAERRKREEEHIRQNDFTRYANDEELNRAQKDQERWNDPAAAFMTKKRTKGPRKPEYTGPPPPPNRFGIKPGYRWDGVDRGNGFEKKYFQKANDRRRTGAQHHEWSVEDM